MVISTLSDPHSAEGALQGKHLNYTLIRRHLPDLIYMKLYSKVGIRTEVEIAASKIAILHLFAHSLKINNIWLSLKVLSFLV